VEETVLELLRFALLMNGLMPKNQQNPAGTAAFCGRTRIIDNAAINRTGFSACKRFGANKVGLNLSRLTNKG